MGEHHKTGVQGCKPTSRLVEMQTRNLFSPRHYQKPQSLTSTDMTFHQVRSFYRDRRVALSAVRSVGSTRKDARSDEYDSFIGVRGLSN